ncbi:hypothetical protein HJG60_011513 [Phyllostomus discolor]|uniref:L1 transposable element RRM domain-containing protein n=1 Tax=Phyllostomus discolor TaxID=89673 RepID=A0A834E0U5_9CHIR|nr:hypothetical protein HJG60_011513 [Phyllostomus discolor]
MRGLGTSRTSLNDPSEGEEEEQQVEKLFEQIIKENFHNLAKEIDFQEVQEAQRIPKKLDPKRNIPKHIIITLVKGKMKERILEAARDKGTVTYKGVAIRLSVDFSKETLQAKKELERSIPSHERQGSTSKISLSSKAFI